MSDEQNMYCTFRAAGRLFGVPILCVKEVTAETTCTRIAHAPKEVLGYVNIRGHVFLALDLRQLLALPAESGTVDRRLVIMKASVGPAFGVIVDEIGEIVPVPASEEEDVDLREREAASGDRSELVAKVCKLYG